MKKLVMINIRINPKKANFLEKFEPSYKLCKFYIIRKQYCILFYIVNQIDSFKYVIQKAKLFYNNIAKNGKIIRILEEA